MRGTPHRPLAQQIALGIALAGLMLVFVGGFLLAFPPKAVANAGLQDALLYDVLGCLEYKDGGHFTPIEDVSTKLKLKRLLAEYHLNDREGSVYIKNTATNRIAWSVLALPLVFNTQNASDTYDMQFLSNGDYRLLVQNFWVEGQSGKHETFRMVVALPVK